MAGEFARNIQDASLNPAAFALHNGAGSDTSAVIDLGTDTVKGERIELELSVPALNTTMVPDTRTVTYIIETSTTSVFTAVARQILNAVATGAGGAGVGAFLMRAKIPSDCERYVRAKITMGASTGDASGVNATLKAKF
jgi:hypothetical protein